MIFIDSNEPMYLVGAEHPDKIRAVALGEPGWPGNLTNFRREGVETVL